MNLYEILEVNENASDETINKIYKIQAKRYHPDLQHTEQEKQIAEEKMKKINDAYSILSNPQRRAEYDNQLKVERAKIEAENQQKIFNQAVRENRNNTGGVNAETNYVQQQPYNSNQVRQKQYTQKDYERDMKKKFRKAKFEFYKNRIIKRFIVVFGVIVVLIIIYYFPPTHRYLVRLYNENAFIKFAVDFFVHIFKFLKEIFNNE